MSFHTRCRRIGKLLSAAALLLPLAGATAARAEIIPLAAMLRGIEMTATECASKPLAVSVRAPGGASASVTICPMPVAPARRRSVYLSGDKLGLFNRNTRTFSPAPTIGTSTPTRWRGARKRSPAGGNDGDLSREARYRRLVREPWQSQDAARVRRHRRGARSDQAAAPIRRLPSGRAVGRRRPGGASARAAR